MITLGLCLRLIAHLTTLDCKLFKLHDTSKIKFKVYGDLAFTLFTIKTSPLYFLHNAVKKRLFYTEFHLTVYRKLGTRRT